MKKYAIFILLLLLPLRAAAELTSATLIEDRLQADGRRWICIEVTDAKGRVFRKHYKINAGVNSETDLANRVASINAYLKEKELQDMLNGIEQGGGITGPQWTETTLEERAIRFLQWTIQHARDKNVEPLRYAKAIIDLYTETQIDNLLGAGKGAKVKALGDKIETMITAVDSSATEAEGIE